MTFGQERQELLVWLFFRNGSCCNIPGLINYHASRWSHQFQFLNELHDSSVNSFCSLVSEFKDGPVVKTSRNIEVSLKSMVSRVSSSKRYLFSCFSKLNSRGLKYSSRRFNWFIRDGHRQNFIWYFVSFLPGLRYRLES